MNRIMLLGRVKDDPILVITPKRSQLVNAILITEEELQPYNRIHQERHRLVFWGGLAQKAMATLKAGRQALIEGKVHTREWDDHSNKDHRVVTEVIVTHLHLLDASGTTIATTMRADSDETR